VFLFPISLTTLTGLSGKRLSCGGLSSTQRLSALSRLATWWLAGWRSPARFDGLNSLPRLSSDWLAAIRRYALWRLTTGR